MDGQKVNMDHEILAKYLAGEASAAEIRLVEEWRAMSDENAREYRKLETLWDTTFTSISVTDKIYNTDKAWENVTSRINKQSELSTSKRLITLTTYFLRVAAVVLFTVAIYYIYISLPTNNVEVLATEAILNHPLPDGSQVTLREGGAITYEEGFDKNRRKVKLQGEAFFDIVKDKNRPFSVEMEGAKVVVLGTSFLIQNIAADSMMSVSVVTGKVAFIAMHSPDTLLLLPGQRGRYNKLNHKFEPLGPSIENALFWKTNTLAFRNERIADVIATLHDAYGKEIIIEDNKILECRFTGRFSDQTLEGILEQLALSFDWKVTFGNTITIEGKGC